MVPVVRHIRNIGMGTALEIGIRITLKLKPQLIVTLDVNGQYDPKEILALTEPVLETSAYSCWSERLQRYEPN
jgi:glycosyltransferase involved in cell wall biosynthesis